MPRRGRALGELGLTEEETRALQEFARSGKTAQAMALRARIVLACAQGLGNREVARQLGVTPQTVGKWRSRFLSRRLRGLLDDPRPGAPRRIEESTVEAIIARTLHDRPAHASRWSARAMARAMDLSGASVIRIWRAFGLRPRRHELEEAGDETPQAGDRLLDVAGVYVSAGIKAIVLCTLPTGQAQARAGAGVERACGEQDEHASLPTLAALEAATRQQGGSQHWRRGAQEFVHFLEQVDAIVPRELPVHVIMNSSGAHPQAVETWMRRHRRFRRYATPARAAWTAQIERWFRLLCRTGHARQSADELEAAVREYLEEHKEDGRAPFAWVRDHHRSVS